MRLSPRHFRGPAFVMAVVLMLFLVPFAGPAGANHGNRTLNVEPESASQPTLGASQSLVAEISEAATVATGPIQIDFENEEGVNDGDEDTPETPDGTCSIPVGESVCEFAYAGDVTGPDQWRAWIDHDGSNDTVEADSFEALNESSNPGEPDVLGCDAGSDDPTPPLGEPDCTDVVEIIWGSNALDCDDNNGPDTEHETRPSGGGSASTQRYVCTVTSAEGDRFGGVEVLGEIENGFNDPDDVDGPSYDNPDYTCTTSNPSLISAGGTCNIDVTQNELEVGTATICFWIEEAFLECSGEATDEGQKEDGSDIATDKVDRTELAWEERAPSGLDAETEEGENDTGAEHEVTATIYDQFGEAFSEESVTVNFEFFYGSPSDDDGNTPGSPDKQCVTQGAACSVTYTSDKPSTDSICVWINEAPRMTGTAGIPNCGGDGATEDGDEADEFEAPDPADDDQDVVQKAWIKSTDATRLDCQPETDKTRQDRSQTVRCLATDDSDAPIADAEIDVEVTGVNDPDGGDTPGTPEFGCVTNQEGKCSFTHGPDGFGDTGKTGKSTYTAWIDADNLNSEAEYDPAEGRDEKATAGEEAEPDNTDIVENRWTKSPCTISGTNKGETLRGTRRADVICGYGGGDTLIGRGGKDVLIGGAGGDDLRGGTKDDTLRGGRGADALSGGRGDDFLNGGPGQDECTGGPGRDRFKSC
jgi:hypothetical protein